MKKLRHCHRMYMIMMMMMITSGQSNLTKRPHRHRIWTVQWYSPGVASVHSTQHMPPWANPLESVFIPKNCAFAWGDLDLTHGLLSPPESSTQTASRSVQPFLHGSLYCDRETDRQTDRPTGTPRYSVCNNRPHLRIHSTAMRPINVHIF